MEQKTEWQIRGKERDPRKTVEIIRNILDSNGFPTEIRFIESGTDDLYSCRLETVGEWDHEFGSNGKGMSKDLAMASAYGELMERIQNQMFFTMVAPFDPEYVNVMGEDNFTFDPDDNNCREMDRWAYKIFGENVIDRLFGDPVKEFRSHLHLKFDEKGKAEGVSMYSVDTGEIVNFPKRLLHEMIGSNGMAAGNTIEEAFVEAVSEIFERYASFEIYFRKYVPPVIPNEFVKRFPQIYALIEDIERSGKYKVRLLDCSLGKKFPVVAGIIFNKETETFGIKFGAHPYMAIALERVFTEATQGKTVDRFTLCSAPEFGRRSKRSRRDIWNQIKVGVGKFTINVLLDEPSYPFEPWGLELLDNPTYVKSLVDLCRGLGSEVYVEDVSFLGFPSVMVYISELSDIRIIGKKDLLDADTTVEILGCITHLRSLTEEEMKKLYNIMKLKQGDYLENTLDSIFMMATGAEYPGGRDSYLFLMMVLAYCLGKYGDAITIAKAIIEQKKVWGEDHTGEYTGLIYLFEGLDSGIEEEKIWSVIRKVCPDSYERLYRNFGERDKVLQKLYPECRNFDCAGCELKNCHVHIARKFYKMMADKKRIYKPDYSVFKNI